MGHLRRDPADAGVVLDTPGPTLAAPFGARSAPTGALAERLHIARFCILAPEPS
jgi:hypothetical protein